ncbi:hypothetical protein Belba_2545 [Belliella baltica DSM 15883]|uniref:Uncharacterized protein n=1 Tax=Belliella baltica (strain DSM 15883 / CIP 108006 / LMG 21964 / BA134) TaxID=866536 RepID=I3Z780_BELBD|nr:hypothetical protein [Belliella baltica]AFL85098.1 hypothetical protein Belba_2545 [Belliella baltica DSM 15883]
MEQKKTTSFIQKNPKTGRLKDIFSVLIDRIQLDAISISGCPSPFDILFERKPKNPI